jgi:rhamnosyltransferase subunit B
MGRRILLAWEIGGGGGHRLMLDWIASELQKNGHEVVVAAPGGEYPAREDVRTLIAPAWPGMVDRSRAMRHSLATSHADTFAAYGLDVPDAFEGLLRSWDEIFRLTKPDVVVAESAPACLAAARGRIPTVAAGNGFTLPPFQIEHYPKLRADERDPTISEEVLLEAANRALRKTSRATLRSLPEMYRSDRACVGTFAEFDPYAAMRRQPPSAPWLPEWEGGSQMLRKEVFGYFSVRTRRLETIISALGRAAFAGIPVSVHIPHAPENISSLLASTRIRVEREPLKLHEIQERARLIVSFGSLGLVSFALAAGIPQIVIPLSLPNGMTGRAVEALHTGRSLRINRDNPIEPALLAQIIQETYVDADLTAHAIARAPDFIGRVFPRTAEVAASMVEELL